MQMETAVIYCSIPTRMAKMKKWKQTISSTGKTIRSNWNPRIRPVRVHRTRPPPEGHQVSEAAHRHLCAWRCVWTLHRDSCEDAHRHYSERSTAQRAINRRRDVFSACDTATQPEFYTAKSSTNCYTWWCGWIPRKVEEKKVRWSKSCNSAPRTFQSRQNYSIM